MSPLDDLRHETLALFPRIRTEVGENLGEARRAALDRSLAHLESGRYVVVVCGEFRRGKSSLLNALVERKSLFPVDVDVTTSVVSTLAHGPTEEAVVHFAPTDPDDPNSAPPPCNVALADVATYVTEQANPDNRLDVSRVDMRAPIEQLASGLVLVDTPGVGSLNPAHTVATRAFLPHADAVLFVCSAVQPLGRVELDFLAYALQHSQVVITAVTMMDRVVGPGPVLAEARERIAVVTGVEAAELALFGVSSLRKRKGLAVGDPEMLAASGFAVLEEELWDRLVGTCGVRQLTLALDALEQALVDGESPLDNELAALADDDELARIDAELRDVSERVRELKASGSRWRRELAQDLEVGARTVRDRLGDDFDVARDEFRAGVAGDAGVSDPDGLVARVSQVMVDAVNRSDSELARLVGRLAERYSAETSVSLTASGVPLRSRPYRVDGVARLDTVEHGDGAFRKFKAGWSGMAAGGGAAALATWAVGLIIPVVPLVGLAATALGTLFGWLGGSRERARAERARVERAQRQHLKEQVLPRIDAAKRQAERDFADKLRDITRALTTGLDNELSASAESIGSSMSRLQELRKRTADQRAARHRELVTARDRFTVLHIALDDVRKRTQTLAR